MTASSWHSATPVDQSITQPSSKKLPIAEDDNLQRNSLLDHMQRTKDFGMSSNKWDVLNFTPPLKAQGSMIKIGWEDYKSYNWWTILRKHHFTDPTGLMCSWTHRNCNNCTSSNQTTISAWRWGTRHQVLRLGKKNYSQIMEERKSHLFSIERSSWPT